MKKLMYFIAYAFLFSGSCLADPLIIISDKMEISHILSSIPVTDKQMNYRSIGARLANLDISVARVLMWKITKKSEIESSEDKIGDVVYQIATSTPSATFTTHFCDMVGSPSYRKRGHEYIPQDRTAVWLMTSRCETPK